MKKLLLLLNRYNRFISKPLRKILNDNNEYNELLMGLFVTVFLILAVLPFLLTVALTTIIVYLIISNIYHIIHLNPNLLIEIFIIISLLSISLGYIAKFIFESFNNKHR